MSKVYLDVDIDGELAAFHLGQAFVEAPVSFKLMETLKLQASMFI